MCNDSQPSVVLLDLATYQQLTTELDTLRQRVAELEQCQNASSLNAINSDIQFRNIIETLSDTTYIVDTEGNFSYLSPQFADLTGYEASEFLGRSPVDLTYPEDIPATLHHIQNVLAGKQEHSEVRIVRKDGTLVWIAANDRSVRDAAGKVIGLQGTVRDISDRKATEEALKESQRKLTTLMSNLPGMAYSCQNDESWTTTFLSEGVLDLTGYPPEAFIGNAVLSFSDLIHPDDRQHVWDVIQLALQGQRSFKVSYRIQTASGQEKWVLEQGRGIFSSSGELRSIEGFTIDISDRKAAEEEQQKFVSILEATTDYVAISDMNGFFTYMNRAGRQMVGFDETEDISQQHFAVTVPPFLQEMLLAEMPRLIEQGIWQGESLLQHRDGQTIPVSQVLMTQRSLSGEVEFIASIGRDISERKAIEEQLRSQTQELETTLQELQSTQLQMIQSEKMSSLGQLVAGVAHEINNPVNFIHGNIKPTQDYIYDLLNLIQLFQKHYPNPAREIQEEIETIDLEFVQDDLIKILTSMKMGTERIKQIVLSLRNFSRMDEAEFKEVDIHEGIENTLVILEHRLKEAADRAPIHIIRDFSELPVVECYAGQLNQVFMNILTNAIDVLEELSPTRPEVTSQITIRTSVLNQDWIEIAIADNGSGIPDEIKQRIFDPFFTTKAVGKGTGMGMSISYQIVTEKHGGKLLCDSVVGEGAEFRIQIPVKQKTVGT